MKFGLQTTLSKKISRRYAQAFFNVAEAADKNAEIYADTLTLIEMLRGSVDLRNFIQNPHNPLDLIEAVIAKLFQGRVQSQTYEFLRFLAQRGRLTILAEILSAFGDLYHHYHGISKVQITSAIELEPIQVDAICKKLKERWNRAIFAETFVNSDLIGGFQIKSGDQVLDLSMKNQLETYRQHVINA